MKDYGVIEQIIPKSYQQEILSEVKNIPWYYVDEIADFKNTNEYEIQFTDENVINSHAFAHVVVNGGEVQSSFYGLFRPITYFFTQKTGVEVLSILRIRLRMTVATPGFEEHNYNPPHVDLNTNVPYKTMVYYVNDSDGDTILFDQKIEPEKEKPRKNITPNILFRNTPRMGDALYFDGHQYHCGNTPVKNKFRLIANFDFIIK